MGLMGYPDRVRDIPERDWKLLRELHGILLDRYSKGVLEKSRALIDDPSVGPHERYLRLYKLIHSTDKELGRALNDMRRSTARRHIVAARTLGLLTDEEMRRFSEETQQAVEAMLSLVR